MLSFMSSWVHPWFSGRSIKQILQTQLYCVSTASANLLFYSTFGRFDRIGFQFNSHFG